MEYLPLFFSLKKNKCLVVGGGKIAERKINALLRANAQVEVISLEFEKNLVERSSQDSKLKLNKKGFESADLKDVALVVSATDDEDLNKRVSELAVEKGILVNVVDSPELSNVIFPSIVDRSPLVVAISTGGVSPVLARSIRTKIETILPSRYGDLAGMLEKYRLLVKAALPNIDYRKAFWEKVLASNIVELVLKNRHQEAEAILEKKINEASANETFYEGEVYLVGAGPGDPDLMTFKALRLLQQADVVLYDRLVSDPIVDLARKDAEKIYVGKSRANHAVPQEEINDLLVRLAKKGKRVCRLKGGDPFIFGRGGEEIEQLVEHGIGFQVVPGITAASGCASYAGIPLTHRDYSQSVMFVTGHSQKDGKDLDWNALAKEQNTLVFYMGLNAVEHICKSLIDHSLSPDCPAALIQQGTTANQKLVVGDVSSLPSLVKSEEIQAPTLIIVGEVVKLREKLSWFS